MCALSHQLLTNDIFQDKLKPHVQTETRSNSSMVQAGSMQPVTGANNCVIETGSIYPANRNYNCRMKTGTDTYIQWK